MFPRLFTKRARAAALGLAALALGACDTGELPPSRTASGPASPSAAEAPTMPAPTILREPLPGDAPSASTAPPSAPASSAPARHP